MSVHMEAGKCLRERKVRCSKICAKVLKCHYRLSGVSLLANAESSPARALSNCLKRALLDHGTEKSSLNSTSFNSISQS